MVSKGISYVSQNMFEVLAEDFEEKPLIKKRTKEPKKPKICTLCQKNHESNDCPDLCKKRLCKTYSLHHVNNCPMRMLCTKCQNYGHIENNCQTSGCKVCFLFNHKTSDCRHKCIRQKCRYDTCHSKRDCPRNENCMICANPGHTVIECKKRCMNKRCPNPEPHDKFSCDK